jgi:hypothetical protein
MERPVEAADELRDRLMQSFGKVLKPAPTGGIVEIECEVAVGPKGALHF